MSTNDSLYESWRADPLDYWESLASRIEWDTPWDTVLDDQARPYGRWFPGARLNTSHNCLDRHIDAGHRHPAMPLRRQVCPRHRRRRAPTQRYGR